MSFSKSSFVGLDAVFRDFVVVACSSVSLLLFRFVGESPDFLRLRFAALIIALRWSSSSIILSSPPLGISAIAFALTVIIIK